MKRSWIAALLSLLTMVGGHFYNRRPYKAVLFLVLAAFLPWVMTYIPQFFWLSQGADPWAATAMSAKVMVAGLVLLAIVSAVVAGIDAGKDPSAPESGALQVTAVILGSLLAVYYMTILVVQSQSFIAMSEQLGSTSGTSTEGFSSSGFSGSVEDTELCLSQGCYGIEKKGSLPAGASSVHGELRIAGEPVSGAEVQLMTFDGMVSESVETASDGSFSISVAPGSHEFIKVRVDARFPEGAWRYTGTTGRESRLEEWPEIGGYHYRPAQPLRFDLEAGESVPLNLSFTRNPRLRQPGFVTEDNVLPGEMQLEWTKVDGTASYGIVLSRIERHKNSSTTSHIPLQRLVSDTNSVSLESVLEKVAGEEDVPDYSVTILAFDEDGRFIAENRSSTDQISLPDGWKVREECRSRWSNCD